MPEEADQVSAPGEVPPERLDEVKTMLAAGHALLEVQMFEGLFTAFTSVLYAAGGMEGEAPRPMLMLESPPDEVVKDFVDRATDAELPLDGGFPEALADAMKARGYIVHQSVISQVAQQGIPAASFEVIREKLSEAGQEITRCIQSMNRTIELMQAATRQ